MLAAVVASTAFADDSVSPVCSGQACAAGWYTSPVFLSWSWSGGSATSGCANQYYATDTDVAMPCSVAFPDGSITRQYFVKLETSAPAAAASMSRPPDSNGWYNHPVAVGFTGSAFSGIAACTPATTYAGPDRKGATFTGTCTDNAGKVARASAALAYDATPPTITRHRVSRRPDFHGWYNHPVTFTFKAKDSLSGMAGCSKVRYSGPSSGAALVIGSCRDRAGNVATLAIPLRYDATPPAVHVSTRAGDQRVKLRWRIDSPLSSFEVSRSPGIGGSASSVVDRSNSGAYNDTQVQNGVRYRYTITARDQAGNVSVRTVTASPGLRLLAPPSGATVTAPPVLTWTPARHATYYNVQLYRAGKKILSAWPRQASIQLTGAWQFGRHSYRLTPGRYRWYVWPGFGSSPHARYGASIGSATFTVAP